MAQIKKELEEANLTHARELEANRTHAREHAEVREGWKKARETHTRELAEVNEGWKMAKETHERGINEALSAMLKGQLRVVSH